MYRLVLFFWKDALYMKNQKIVKISEASRLIGVSRYYVVKLIEENKLVQMIIGNTKFITIESLSRLIAEIGGSDSNE